MLHCLSLHKNTNRICPFYLPIEASTSHSVTAPAPEATANFIRAPAVEREGRLLCYFFLCFYFLPRITAKILNMGVEKLDSFDWADESSNCFYSNFISSTQ